VLVAFVLGTRPEIIKLSPVVKELGTRPGVTCTIIHTGQHYDRTLDAVLFEELRLPPPGCQLGIGTATHASQTARMLVGIEKALAEVRPAFVVVQGDTNSTLAGALAAVKLGLPVAHVEAGLRSFDRSMPEEINRVVVDHASPLLFAPTPQAMRNLEAEGLAGKARLVGNTVVDALAQVRSNGGGAGPHSPPNPPTSPRAGEGEAPGTSEARTEPCWHLDMLAVTGDHKCKRQDAKCKVQDGQASWLSATIRLRPRLRRDFVDHPPSHEASAGLRRPSTITYDRRSSRSCLDGNPPYLLVTLHRCSNTDDGARLGRVLRELARLPAETGLRVLFPAHPRTMDRAASFGLAGLLPGDPGIAVVAPMGHRDFLAALAGAAVVITDSGGVQEEACILGIPAVTLRRSTERPETLEVGANRLVPEPEGLPAAVQAALAAGRGGWSHPYGDGAAARRIADVIVSAP
jgi:UDP-N-acetylglucosamine 2-epimerase